MPQPALSSNCRPLQGFGYLAEVEWKVGFEALKPG